MKVKLISAISSIEELELAINKFIEENKIEVISIQITAHVMNDYFMDSAPPRICNTWYEYIAVVSHK